MGEQEAEIQQANTDRNSDQQMCCLIGGSVVLSVVLCCCLCVILPTVVLIVLYFLVFKDTVDELAKDLGDDDKWTNSSTWIDEDFNN